MKSLYKHWGPNKLLDWLPCWASCSARWAASYLYTAESRSARPSRSRWQRHLSCTPFCRGRIKFQTSGVSPFCLSAITWPLTTCARLGYVYPILPRTCGVTSQAPPTTWRLISTVGKSLDNHLVLVLLWNTMESMAQHIKLQGPLLWLRPSSGPWR